MISYPKLNRNATSRVIVPTLDGGINQAENCKNIADNQLVNAKNVWFDKQALKTRPKITRCDGDKEKIRLDAKYRPICTYTEYSNDNDYSVINIYYKINDKGSFYTLELAGDITEIPSFHTNIIKTNELNAFATSEFEATGTSYKGTPTDSNGTGIYILLSLYSEKNEKGALIYEVVKNDDSFEFDLLYRNVSELSGVGDFATTDKLYKPLIYINGKGNKYSELETTAQTEYAPASVLEGKNLLPSGFRLQYISDGKSDEYILPCEIDINNQAEIELNIAGFEWTNIKDSDGNSYDTTLNFKRTVDTVYTYTYNGSSYKIQAGFTKNSFYFTNGSSKVALPQSQTSNNIELTAYNVDWDDYDKIVNMTISETYGGGSGIFGGSRVFLAGYKNFICYSTAQSSTYFSENNYVGVGDLSNITALAKMNELLVIFKANSIYATQTTYSDSVSADSVQNGAVVDISTTYCYFPIYQLTNEVGCDIPNSIKLCLNRLIFANTSNDIYCLVTQSSNSQRNVYCLSEQIKSKLDLKENSFSATFSDYYLLFSGKKVYVLNYNRDSYRYIYSYTNKTTNTSTRYLTWWYWEIDELFSGAISYKNKVYLRQLTAVASIESSGMDLITYYYKLYEDTSDDQCEVLIETKVFDFGIPERYKKIEKIYLGVGNDEYAEINLSINTDKGEVYHRPLFISNDEKISTADYGQEIRLIPFCNKIRQFNIKLEATGVVSLDGVVIYYKQMGEVMS